jgi:hypothetical protein
MSVWKRLRRWEKAFVIVLTFIVLFLIAINIRDYYWALDEAFEACSKGDLELCQDLRNLAGRIIGRIFMTLWIFVIGVSPIIVYRYRKGG